LEAREHAQRRGATIFARIAGYASRHEAPATPGGRRTGRAISQSITAALAKAGMQPADMGHVNAHGESSIEQDRLEAEAIKQTLGSVPVTAIKSYFGDLAAGSGAVELIASVLALQEGRAPPIRNLEEPDTACPIEGIRGDWRPVSKRTAIALNQSSTGQAAAVIITRD
jgi:3-oxoacyl-[acyl-carrier-protein] synthase II